MFIKIMSLAVFVVYMLIERCHCASEIIRNIEEPNIKPLYLNVSESAEENKVTVYGKFRGPKDTTGKMKYGTIVKFDKVLDSTEESSEYEFVLSHDSRRYWPRITLTSKSALESMKIYFNWIVDEPVQSKFTGGNCLVGINKSSENHSTTYTPVLQNCNHRIDDYFKFGFNKSGEIVQLHSDMYCFSGNDEYKKYFTSNCTLSGPFHLSYVTFYENKMAADNVQLLYLNYMFSPVGPCSYQCIADLKEWFFSII
ncbi:uncharacterized protein LOC133197939 [Saccostrea echinata]|uniref:uncharacterized protein LOC133197939 n=1 Tax=Saccostrea echinata TaxID=191078 RepID=UPI002A808580|nr:uncharacterized protein LOC133197939 [Saccostrea echinata]